MFKLLTATQLRIADRVKGFLHDTPTLTVLRPMFREEGESLNVGLMATYYAEYHIVRQTFGAAWTDDQINLAVADMMKIILDQIADHAQVA